MAGDLVTGFAAGLAADFGTGLWGLADGMNRPCERTHARIAARAKKVIRKTRTTKNHPWTARNQRPLGPGTVKGKMGGRTFGVQ
ncbi:MAG: hypothetical protein LBH31_03340, partial [Burkholderiaceae bacterium]|nr:hypothetical protein [Burkholderiaceae bacterium]